MGSSLSSPTAAAAAATAHTAGAVKASVAEALASYHNAMRDLEATKVKLSELTSLLEVEKKEKAHTSDLLAAAKEHQAEIRGELNGLQSIHKTTLTRLEREKTARSKLSRQVAALKREVEMVQTRPLNSLELASCLAPVTTTEIGSTQDGCAICDEVFLTDGNSVIAKFRNCGCLVHPTCVTAQLMDRRCPSCKKFFHPVIKIENSAAATATTTN